MGGLAGVAGEGGVVGRRHLPVTGRDAAFRHPAVLGYLFLGALMLRNSVQNNRYSVNFLSLPAAKRGCNP